MASSSAHSSITLTTLRPDRAVLPAVEIVVTQPGREPAAYALGLAPLSVGTHAECDIVVTDPSVSRRHSELCLTERGLLVRDLGSKNGSVIDGVSVREAYLPPTGVLELGAVSLRVQVVGAPSEIALWPGPRFGDALGGSVVMRALFATLDRGARTSETILLLGESGTGKEILAHAIHRASAQHEGPFVVFDAAATSPELVEADLFGHVRGAFTGATHDREGVFSQADGGTLFLDEIGELPLELQPKLLRVLEARQFRPVGSNVWQPLRARVVAATHNDLRAAVAQGRFRQDLFYRLAVIEARVPSLRERKEDIELLAERFLAASTPARTVLDLPPNALNMFAGYDWPGNVRELRNAVARLVLFPDAGKDAFDGARRAAGAFDAEDLAKLPWREAREEAGAQFERSYLVLKLRETEGNVSKAAAAMGVSRQFVHRLMERHGLRSGEPL